MFNPKTKIFTSQIFHPNQHKLQNLIFIFATFLLFVACFCVLTVVQISEKKEQGNVFAASYKEYYFVIMMGDNSNYDLSNIAYNGTLKWTIGTTIFPNSSNYVYTEYESYKSATAWFACVGFQYMKDCRRNVTIDFTAINTLTGNKIKEIYAYDSSGNKCLSITQNTTLEKTVTDDDYGWTEIGSTLESFYVVCTLYVEWIETNIGISYYDQNSSTFSGTHESVYRTEHTNGEATALDAPTRAGYVFDGWYLNDSTCSTASAKITKLSASTTYTEINLYAKWNALITLTCTNFDKQRYMIYVYSGDTLKMQISPTKQTETIELEAVSNYTTTPYKVCFVFGYYGKIEFTSLSNATYIGRNATITTFATTAINYTIATPQINSSIMI